MQAQDRTVAQTVDSGVTVRCPDRPPALNASAARTLLKILLRVAESERERTSVRDRAA